MKKIFSTLLLLFIVSVVHSQYGPQQIISSNADLAFRAIPHDMNNDGFMDVVSASYLDATIAWYRNIDGLGTFGNPNIITDSALAMLSMELFDLDGDGDMDVLYSTNLEKIAWLENLDGLGNFGEERLIVTVSYPYAITSCDLDNDDDMDILVNLGEELVWYENIDGLGNFGPAVQIVVEPDGFGQVRSIDLDNDGDMDIVTATNGYAPHKLIWYENIDGMGNFSPQQDIYQFAFSSDWTDIVNIAPADLNGDGKTDLLIDTFIEQLPDYILWLEHLDGEGTFEQPRSIYVKHTSLGSLRSYDLDGDLDEDILVSFYWNANSVAWFENTDGQGSFGPKQNITTALNRGTDATAADLNGDGDLDVISASSFDDKIAWYEYLKPLDVSDNINSTFQIYPNPTTGRMAINSTETVSEIQLYNTLGQEIGLIWAASEVDLSGIKQGIYFLKIISTNGFSETHKVVKK